MGMVGYCETYITTIAERVAFVNKQDWKCQRRERLQLYITSGFMAVSRGQPRLLAGFLPTGYKLLSTIHPVQHPAYRIQLAACSYGL